MAEKKDFLKHIKPALFTFTLILGIVILVWTIKPKPREQKIQSLFLPEEIFNRDINCNFPVDLKDSRILVYYPNSIRLGDSLPINVEMELVSRKLIEENLCSIDFEVKVEAQPTHDFKEIRIIEKYKGQPKLRYFLELNPIDYQEINGSIWIFLSAKGSRALGIFRTPLFAIPFSVGMKTYFGLDYTFFQYAGFILIVFSIKELFSFFLGKPAE